MDIELAGTQIQEGTSFLEGFVSEDDQEIVRRHKREGANVSLEDFIAQAGRAVPMGRMGRAEEFANVATFLASDAASYVTGCAINVDGGRSPVV